MKIIHKDLRAGVVKVGVENLDDLWYLSHIINPGDIVKARTERRLKAKDDMVRAGKSERVTVTVSIKVEKAEFKLENDTYRITGVIEQAPEDVVSIGSHHTINVEKETVLSIIKDRWTAFDIERLKDAEKSAVRPKLLIAVIDEGEACIGLVRESKIEEYDLSKMIGGKYDTKGRQERKEEFYKELSDLMSKTLQKENISSVILAGAGFEKENFYKYLAEHDRKVAAASVMENIGSHGRAGINEVMKRSKVKKIDEEVNAARDIKLVSRLLEEIGKESGLGIYGIGDVENAAAMGAIETLLVCDDYFMKTRERLEPLMQSVKAGKGIVHLVNNAGDAGKQLTGLGGIAAVLRFRTK